MSVRVNNVTALTKENLQDAGVEQIEIVGGCFSRTVCDESVVEVTARDAVG